MTVELTLEGGAALWTRERGAWVNVAARRNAAPPANVVTMLQVLTPPIADTAKSARPAGRQIGSAW